MKLGLQPVKTCIACGKTHPIANFYFTSVDRTKRQAKCRRCHNLASDANRRSRLERARSGESRLDDRCIGRVEVLRREDGELVMVRRQA